MLIVRSIRYTGLHTFVRPVRYASVYFIKPVRYIYIYIYTVRPVIYPDVCTVNLLDIQGYVL